MDLLVKNKVCLVTGASRGIGKAIAMLLAQEGGYVYAVARTTEDIQRWITEYNMADKVVPVGMDISDPMLQKALIMRIRKERGRLDVLVNNAAIEKNERIGMITQQSMQRMFEVNVFAPIEDGAPKSTAVSDVQPLTVSVPKPPLMPGRTNVARDVQP